MNASIVGTAGSACAIVSGTMKIAAIAALCSSTDTGIVYHLRPPTLIVGLEISVNTVVLLVWLRFPQDPRVRVDPAGFSCWFFL